MLDFSRNDVREHIYGQLKKVLSSADISYVKWDMNRSIADVFSGETEQGKVTYQYVLGVYDFLERLLQKYPDVKDLFEYEDYRSVPNRENAHDLIMAVLEAHPELLQERKGYVSYMANRPGVEKIIGHGLFSAGDSQPDIAKVQEELSEYPGNVWTHIVSLHREDAARLGFDSVEAWQGLLNQNAYRIAEAMRITPETFDGVPPFTTKLITHMFT